MNPFFDKNDLSDNKYQPINSSAQFEKASSYLSLHHSDGGITHCIHSTPENKKTNDILVLVPGFITITDTWDIFLSNIQNDIEFYYWETREKGSFKPNGSLSLETFSKDRLTLDLVELFSLLPENRNIILIGSSFGGTIIIDALSQQLISPYHTILIGANTDFKVPWFANILTKILPGKLLSLFKPLIKLFIKYIILDSKNDKTQSDKYSKAIDLANFTHIKYTVLNYHNHPQLHLLHKIKSDVTIIGAVHDKMHTIEESNETVNLIHNSKFVQFENNKDTHTMPLVNYFTNTFLS